MTRLELWICAPLFLLPTAALTAQTVHGRVTNRGADAPVSGVVVALVDSTGAAVARALSDAGGQYRLSAPRPGTYRIRAQRIGFRPIVSDTVTLAFGAELERPIALAGVVVSLDTVRVAERSVCGSVGDSAAATFAMWEQTRTALQAAQLTSRLRGVSATVVAYERTLDPQTRRIRDQAVSVKSGFVTQPWQSPSAAALRREGYVVQDDQGWTVYRVPGLDILLSDAFVQDHCFRVERSRDRNRIGIAFEPTRDRRELPEIKGTVWLDRATAALRSMEFGYVHLTREQEGESGGELQFVQLRDGGWAIARWNVRMPVLAQQNFGGRTQVRFAEIRVAGGDLSFAARGNDTLWARPPVTLAGIVRDSLSNDGIANARIALHGTVLTATSSSAGRFSMTGVLPGEYTLEVRTAGLDSIGAVHQSSIMVTDDDEPLQVRVPTARQVLAALPASARVAEFTGGVYTDSSGQPMADVEVALPDLRRFASTNADGSFRLSDIPPGQHRVMVRRVGYGPVDTTLNFAMRETVRRRFVLTRTPVLDTVRVRAVGLIPSFDEHRALGRGKFVTREQLEAMTNRPMSAVLADFPSSRLVQMTRSGGAVLATRRRAMATLRPIDPAAGDMRRVIEEGFCPATVYLNNAAVYKGEPGEPVFNVNTLSPDDIEAIEFYASAAEVPPRYAGKNVECGVLVIHTRRGRR